MSEKPSRYEDGADISKAWIEFWNSLPADAQREIKEKIDVRRDEAELSIAIVGRLLAMSKNQNLKDAGEFLKGIGETLVVDDIIKNILKWFRERTSGT
ncbi:hypothetical protein ES703_04762 [subsurface metagenome]